MRQYCRYCASLINGDALYCEIKDKVLSDSQIKRANTCKDYAYCGLNEDGFKHIPKKYKRKKDIHSIQLFTEEIITEEKEGQ